MFDVYLSHGFISEHVLIYFRLQLGHFLSSVATFLSGVLIAFICCWEVSLLTLFVVPLILVIGATYTKKMNVISAAKMIYLSEATSIIEEVM